MRYLVWVLRLIVFVLVLLFALKNTGPVDVNFFADQVVTGVPLIVVMLVVFILGIIFGVLLAFPSVMRRRRETRGCGANWRVSRKRPGAPPWCPTRSPRKPWRLWHPCN